MRKATGIEESFTIFRNELLKNQIHSIIFLLDKTKKFLVPRYFSFDINILAQFVTTSGKEFETLHIPVRGISDKYEKILYKGQTIFSRDVAGDLLKIMQTFPDSDEELYLEHTGENVTIGKGGFDMVEEV